MKVDILDIVVPAYKAGITVDLIDYHVVNYRKTVDKYSDISEDVLNEIMYCWESERKVLQASLFTGEDGDASRKASVIITVMSDDYNHIREKEKTDIIKGVILRMMEQAYLDKIPGRYIPSAEELSEAHNIQKDYENWINSLKNEKIKSVLINTIQEKNETPIKALYDMWIGITISSHPCSSQILISDSILGNSALVVLPSKSVASPQ